MPILAAMITCSQCGHAEVETMPTAYCQYLYACKGCGAILRADPGHCCVFCLFSDQMCPPKQCGESCCDVVATALTGTAQTGAPPPRPLR